MLQLCQVRVQEEHKVAVSMHKARQVKFVGFFLSPSQHFSLGSHELDIYTYREAAFSVQERNTFFGNKTNMSLRKKGKFSPVQHGIAAFYSWPWAFPSCTLGPS